VNSLSRVAIVGRPNVGKSTLFNRMSGARKAIVDRVAGSTRDRNVSVVEWNGKSFELVDTGGILEEVETPLEQQVGLQVETAIEEAQLVCWVVDGRTGLLPEEQFLGKRLRAISDRVILAVNKIDTANQIPDAGEFHRMGFSALFEVSAEHGLGVAELMDALTDRIPQTSEFVEPDEIRVAITGRPNVGKSSLLNQLAGEQRSVVSEVAGTTRDAVDTLLDVDGQRYRFVDTAGIRRQGKIPNQADRMGVMYAERAIERAHLCILLLDATAGPTTEDASIGSKIAKAGRGAVLIFNKWDLIEGREAVAKELALDTRDKLPHLDFAPIVFLSATTGRGMKGIFPRLRAVREQHLLRVSTPELNRFLVTATTRLPPRARDGREVRLLYMAQTGVAPPRFAVFGNRSREELDATYPRYLAHRLREAFGFEGTPLRVAIRKRKRPNTQ
jgi:GTP-binding protein